MQVEFGRGVMLSSKDIHEGWAATVRHNFRQSCTVIHSILHKAANARVQINKKNKKNYSKEFFKTLLTFSTVIFFFTATS